MLTRKVGEVLKNFSPLKFPQDSYGLEIETESQGQLPTGDVFMEGRDGSLRGDYAKEFILKNPSESVDELISNVRTFYGNLSHKIAPSYRAATHLHMNVLNNTFMDVSNILFKYYGVEEVFSYHYNKERYENPFSLNFKSAEFPVIIYLNAIRKKEPRELHDDDLRYASLNLASLYRKGSLEFRAFETPSEPGILIEWINAIHSLKRPTCRTPDHFLKMFSTMPVDRFLSEAYGSPIKDMAREVPEYKTLIIGSIQNLKVWINEIEWK